MKKVTVVRVEEPQSYTDVAFSQEEWRAAAKQKQFTAYMGAALETVKLSKGLYRIVPEKKGIDVNVQGVSLDTMDADQLKITAASLGITLRKRVKIGELRDLIARKMADVVVVDDEAEA